MVIFIYDSLKKKKCQRTVGGLKIIIHDDFKPGSFFYEKTTAKAL